MDLFKEQQFVALPTITATDLQVFDHKSIAFVVGIDYDGHHSLCITKAGQYLFSSLRPVKLFEQLEKQWQIYSWPIHQELPDAWEKTVKLAQDANVNINNLHEPLRVATSGKDSFWSPNPSNELGLWFFTPTCQAITINGNKVEFTTTDQGQVTHWMGQKENRLALKVTQARVDLFATYVLRKAAITQRYAAQLFSQVAHDQGVDLPEYPYVPLKPQFPLSQRYADDKLIESVALYFFGSDVDAWGSFVKALTVLMDAKGK